MTSDKVHVYKMDFQNENDSDKRKPNNAYIIRETCLFAQPSQTDNENDSERSLALNGKIKHLCSYRLIWSELEFEFGEGCC